MVRAEPANTRTAGMDTNHSTMFTLLLELNVMGGQRWIQFEFQNIPIRAFAISIYLFLSRHEVHSVNTHSAERKLIKTDKTERSTRH